MLDMDEVYGALVKLHVGTVTNEPSVVSLSPYRYIYVYLTPREQEGTHIIVSDGDEWGEHGYLVGTFADYESCSDDTICVPTLKSVVQEVTRLAADYALGLSDPL